MGKVIHREQTAQPGAGMHLGRRSFGGGGGGGALYVLHCTPVAEGGHCRGLFTSEESAPPPHTHTHPCEADVEIHELHLSDTSTKIHKYTIKTSQIIILPPQTAC